MYKIARDNTVVKVIKDWTVRLGWFTFTQPAGTTVFLETYDDRTHEYLVNFGAGQKWFQRKVYWLHQMKVEDHCEMEEEIPKPLGAGSILSFIDHIIRDIQREWQTRVIGTTTQSLTDSELGRLEELLTIWFSTRK